VLGIKAIETYFPQDISNNLDVLEKFQISKDFLINKIGVLEKRKIGKHEETSTIAHQAFCNLLKSHPLDASQIEVLIVVTQNPDSNIPHVSGMLHHMSNLNNNCATFDISLGCSGYVYGLSIIQSFMESNNLKNGVLITADPYSKIIDENDKNTSLLFGDAAAATWISSNSPIYSFQKFEFGSKGDNVGGLECKNGTLSMNGREVFNFAMKEIPKSILKLLEKNKLNLTEIDAFIFHQGSKAILDSLTKALKINHEKVINNMTEVGNTVSSTIPLILKELMRKEPPNTVLISGFGVGFSFASCIISKIHGS